MVPVVASQAIPEKLWKLLDVPMTVSAQVAGSTELNTAGTSNVIQYSCVKSSFAKSHAGRNGMLPTVETFSGLLRVIEAHWVRTPSGLTAWLVGVTGLTSPAGAAQSAARSAGTAAAEAAMFVHASGRAASLAAGINAATNSAQHKDVPILFIVIDPPPAWSMLQPAPRQLASTC